MKIVGIIVEYNPLHNGHIFHINESVKKSGADLLIAVMSGNVVQRGEFSSFDKFTKTKWALNAGIDLVIELPGLYTLQNADIFAYTAVALLDKAGVNEIYFGSEHGAIHPLKTAAEIMRTPLYNEKIKAYLNLGYSYPSSADQALYDLTHNTIHKNPNDILGIQYINAAWNINSTIRLDVIKRSESGYYDAYDDDKTIQSATALRQRLINQKSIKSAVPSFVSQDTAKFFDHAQVFPYIKYALTTHRKETLKEVFGVDEGIETHLLKNYKADTFSDLMNQLSTKRYTHAKLKRILMHMVLRSTKDNLPSFDVPYLRILGMNEAGQKHLNSLKHTIDIPLITKIKRTKHALLEMELQISKLYSVLSGNDVYNEEFNPVIIL